MNATIGSQFLFSGNRPDTPALEDPDVILAELRNVVTAAPDVATAITDLDAWFQPGGDYDTIAALGSATGGGDVYLDEGQRIDTAVTVHDAGIRTALSGLAMAALAAEGTVPAVPADARFDMASAAARRMLQGEADLVTTRSGLGAAEARIEAARVQAEATRTTLELEETRLTSADPYTTATEIESVRLQLENLFVLTSRLSNLSLTSYLG